MESSLLVTDNQIRMCGSRARIRCDKRQGRRLEQVLDRRNKRSTNDQPGVTFASTIIRGVNDTDEPLQIGARDRIYCVEWRDSDDHVEQSSTREEEKDNLVWAQQTDSGEGEVSRNHNNRREEEYIFQTAIKKEKWVFVKKSSVAGDSSLRRMSLRR